MLLILDSVMCNPTKILVKSNKAVPTLPSAGQWAQIQPSASSPLARYDHSAATVLTPNFTATSEMLLFGGGSSAGVLNDLWLFNAETVTWTQLMQNGSTGAPPPRMGGFSAFVGGFGFVVGFGGANSVNFNDLWLFPYEFGQTFASKWIQLSNGSVVMGGPSPRFHPCGVGYPGGDILFFGGNDNYEEYNDIWSFTLTTSYPYNGWSMLAVNGAPNAPVPGGGQTSVLIPNFGMYVFGDINDQYNTLWLFSTEGIATNRWIVADANGTLGAPPPRRFPAGPSLTPLNGNIGGVIIFGGSASASGPAFNDLWSYNDVEESWILLSKNGASGAPSQRWHTSACYMPQGIFIFGGMTTTTPELNDLWVFIPPSM